MPKGRKPKPTNVKKVIGTLRKDRVLSNEWTPTKLKTIPAPPDGHNFDEQSVSIWYLHLCAMAEAHIMTDVDIPQFFIYVTAVQQHRKMTKEIATEGETLINDKGIPFINPKIRIAKMASDTIVRLAGEFGFTPSSRTRIGTGGGKEDKTKGDKFSKLGL